MIEVKDYDGVSCAIRFLSSQGRSYAVYGMGNYTHSLLRCLKSRQLPLPLFIFDDKPAMDVYESVPVFSSLSAPFDKADEIVLGSDRFQKEMELKMRKLKPGAGKCIDLSAFCLTHKPTPSAPPAAAPQPAQSHGLANVNFALHKDNLKRFRNIHKGERAFVIGNGPSLRSMDMGRLKGEVTLGCNRVFLGFPEWGFNFKYWAVVDETNIRQSADEYVRVLPEEVVKFIPIRFMDLFDLTRFQNCHPINIGFDPKPFPKMSTSPEIIYDGWCAAYSLLQLAIIMGCAPIYLLGVDYRYDIKPGDAVKGGWSAAGSRNHFTQSYCNADKGLVWNYPSFERTDKAFALMKEWNDANGQVIMNATPNSALEAFPHVDFNSLF